MNVRVKFKFTSETLWSDLCPCCQLVCHASELLLLLNASDDNCQSSRTFAQSLVHHHRRPHRHLRSTSIPHTEHTTCGPLSRFYRLSCNTAMHARHDTVCLSVRMLHAGIALKRLNRSLYKLRYNQRSVVV